LLPAGTLQSTERYVVDVQHTDEAASADVQMRYVDVAQLDDGTCIQLGFEMVDKGSATVPKLESPTTNTEKELESTPVTPTKSAPTKKTKKNKNNHFKCVCCGKYFSHTSTLKSHHNKKHPTCHDQHVITVRPYACDKCGKDY